tara:strand:- start:13011 stop:13865 length:855 start_codon:yes stop_codon:yes gene_type:complete
MTNKSKGSFSLLNPKEKIFEEIKTQMPNWWIQLRNDNELYIDIRKDNSINVYYFGGSIARIQFKNDFVAEIHQKYLGDLTPRGKTKKGKDKFEYDQINLSLLDKQSIEKIKERIKKEYLKNINNEKPAEKWIQGKLITEKSNYIDSEFQFNQNPKIGKLRIDLVELLSGELSFVELKGITDTRLRNDEKRNINVPEIIEQMEKYKLFIKLYENDIKQYYEKLLEIKQDLKLTTIIKTEFNVSKNPKLIIIDTYKKMTEKRKERIFDIKKLLENYGIDYVIKKIE